ncbi:phosphoenolpyruvate carboxykinase (ATP) [Lignipirellula cremea]|uniref:Phosphoenolpyruvate carboxykinase (ATP) n=1 Tax=Lignipirellula cremea TaxID=2528010 RepID=A0A518DYP1_9BACT|nr:phosphoenolpyruvate carboxykinase (ATP) [Lignipirellula cremea]QDU96958.1 Phosphoenolpyruvate carboxykinase [ATP] [Lignipirellula cremea]
MMKGCDLNRYGMNVSETYRNLSPARLYEHALQNDHAMITSAGALATISYQKTGRSPGDKRLVDSPEIHDDVWWGPVNIPLEKEAFQANRQRAIDYLRVQPRLYVVDGYAGWDPAQQLKIRVLCARPYHALFMHNMLIRPTAEQLADFGEPDYVIFNAGEFTADPATPGMTSSTSVCLDLVGGEFVILGTQYAGEMKKGVFTIMHYLMPKREVLSMHCSANEGPDGDVSLFFGLSGTGKTTLSADSRRALIGDDEHCWTDDGVFNIEGGCYAKCIDLSAEKEPEIFSAVRFGSVLENTVQDPVTREVDYHDSSLTENTRAAYPIEFIPHAKTPCLGGHPQNIILLTCDAFGVLPPVSKLTSEQAMYHFISGYTAKVAGTEVGVTEPEATFSACYGAAFLVWHPTRYAELLAEKINRHGTHAWLINTGWSGGAYGAGSRIRLAYTRAIIDAIHSGELAETPTVEDPIFGLAIPQSCPQIPKELLTPRNTWEKEADYDEAARALAKAFHDNFARFADVASEAIAAAGPIDVALAK